MKLAIVAATLTALILPAHADEPRHLDFTVALTGIDGRPMTHTDAKGAPTDEILTLGDVCVIALEMQIEEDKNLPADKKFQRDELARKVYKRNDVVLEAQDLAMLKERIGKVYGPAQVGPAWRLLDPAMK